MVSSSFSTPCQPASDAFFSGYVDGNESGDMTFVTTVNSTDPIVRSSYHPSLFSTMSTREIENTSDQISGFIVPLELIAKKAW